MMNSDADKLDSGSNGWNIRTRSMTHNTSQQMDLDPTCEDQVDQPHNLESEPTLSLPTSQPRGKKAKSKSQRIDQVEQDPDNTNDMIDLFDQALCRADEIMAIGEITDPLDNLDDVGSRQQSGFVEESMLGSNEPNNQPNVAIQANTDTSRGRSAGLAEQVISNVPALEDEIATSPPPPQLTKPVTTTRIPSVASLISKRKPDNIIDTFKDPRKTGRVSEPIEFQSRDSRILRTKGIASKSNLGPSSKPVVIHQVEHIVKVSQLQPGDLNWTLIGRCVRVTELREIHNDHGNSYVINFDLMDEASDVVTCVCFGDLAAEINNNVKMNEVYSLSGAGIKQASKYNRTGQQYELTPTPHTRLFLIDEDQLHFQVPQLEWKFLDLLKIHEYDKNASLDFIGVVFMVTASRIKYAKDKGVFFSVRDVVLVNQSMRQVQLKLWNTIAIRLGK
eukprot:g3372.t1